MSDEINAVEAAPEVQSEAVESAPEASTEEVSSEVAESSSEASEGDSGSEAVEVQAETEEELEQEIEQAIEEGASEEEVKSMIRQFTLKVDGKEFTKELDLNDADAVRAELQKAYKGQLTMQEKAEQEKLFSQFLDFAKADPFEAIKRLNPDFDPLDYADQYFAKLLKEQEMSPEEKAATERERKYQEAIDKAERLEKEAKERAEAEENAKLTASFKSNIESALDADPELANDPYNVSRVAFHMHQAAQKGIELEPKQVLESVKKEIRDYFEKPKRMLKNQDLVKNYMGDDLKELMEAERKARVAAQAKKVPSANSVSPVSKKEPSEKKEEKKITLSEFRRSLGR